MKNFTLNIKFYNDYERGFLNMNYLFKIIENFKKSKIQIEKVLTVDIAKVKG